MDHIYIMQECPFNDEFDISFIVDLVLTKMVILEDQGMSYQLSSAKGIKYMKKRSRTNVHKNHNLNENSTLLMTHLIDLEIYIVFASNMSNTRPMYSMACSYFGGSPSNRHL